MIDKLKLMMANHMLKFFPDFFVTAATCLALAALGSSPARGDGLPGADTRGDTTSSYIPLRSTSGALPADVTQRQHVKHLRAHKKLSLDAPSDLTQPTDKPEKAQSSGAKRVSDDAGVKVDADGATAPNTTKAIVKPRSAKIIRARREVNEKARPVPNTGARTVQQGDFFSEIFGRDD